MPTIDLPGPFIDDSDMPISASAAVDLWRDAAIQLDRWAYRDLPMLEGLTAPDPVAPDEHSSGDLRLARWGCLWQTGLTQIVVTGLAANWTSGSSLVFYVNGVLKATASAASSWTLAADISSGYSVGQDLTIELRTSGNTSRWSQYDILDAYATTLGISTPWPGVPTFSGFVFNAARLNQLSDAAQWLFDRINGVPLVPLLGMRRRQGTHKPQQLTLLQGSITRTTANQVLRVFGEITCNNPEEYLVVEIGGVQAARWPSSGYAPANGQTSYPYLPISLASYSLGVPQQVRIRNIVVTGGQQPGQAGINSLWSLYVAGTEAPSGGYPYATPPARLPGYTADSSSDVTPTQLQDTLNSIAQLLLATYTRIQATPTVWNRLRLTRWRYAQDDRQNAKLEPTYRHRGARQGDRLVVRAKNARLCWGAFTVETDEEGKQTTKYQYEETLTAGDAIETKTIYFDAYPSLFPGTTYYLAGDIYLAQEYLT